MSRKTSNISSAEMRPLPLTSYSAKANCSFSSSVALAESVERARLNSLKVSAPDLSSL